MPKIENIELRSEEVQEILTRVPHKLIRWGSSIILSILLLLLFVSWFIKYPDIIATEIVITTQIPPQKLLAGSNGKIIALLANDKTEVEPNQPIAVIENVANYNEVFKLKSITDTIDIQKNNFPFRLFSSSEFGEIETAFSVFQKESTAFELNNSLQPYKVDGTAHSIETIQLQERLQLLISQKDISESEMQLQKKDLERYETLFKKGIISAQEIEKQKLSYLQTQKNYKNLLSSISQLNSSLNELRRVSKATQINESKDNVNLERNKIQAFLQLKKAIKDWELKYVMRSAIQGKLSYLQLWAVNQTVNTGDAIFAIIPNKKEAKYIGKAKAKNQNSGKIEVGQKVNIRLANYPDREFGVLEGRVKNISLTPDKDGNLLIDVELPNGLQTSYKKTIHFQQEMTGTADIVTKDLRLIDRFLYQFRDLFKR